MCFIINTILHVLAYSLSLCTSSHSPQPFGKWFIRTLGGDQFVFNSLQYKFQQEKVTEDIASWRFVRI